MRLKIAPLFETGCGCWCIVENRGELNAPCLAQQPKCVVLYSACGPTGICQCISGYASRDNRTCRQYFALLSVPYIKPSNLQLIVHLCFLCDGNNYDSTSIRQTKDISSGVASLRHKEATASSCFFANQKVDKDLLTHFTKMKIFCFKIHNSDVTRASLFGSNTHRNRLAAGASPWPD